MENDTIMTLEWKQAHMPGQGGAKTAMDLIFNETEKQLYGQDGVEHMQRFTRS